MLKVAKAPTDIAVLSPLISDRSGQLAHEWALRLGQLWLEDMWKRLGTFSAILAANNVRLGRRKDGWSVPSVWREIASILAQKSNVRLDQEAASQFENHDLLVRTLEGIPEGIIEILDEEIAAAVKFLGHGDGGWMHPDSSSAAQHEEQGSLLAARFSSLTELAGAKTSSV